jgi:hypothetical protein
MNLELAYSSKKIKEKNIIMKTSFNFTNLKILMIYKSIFVTTCNNRYAVMLVKKIQVINCGRN